MVNERKVWPRQRAWIAYLMKQTCRAKLHTEQDRGVGRGGQR